eukprot:scaffold13810_cov151-Isochrysis_galbana.AAC.1
MCRAVDIPSTIICNIRNIKETYGGTPPAYVRSSIETTERDTPTPYCFIFGTQAPLGRARADGRGAMQPPQPPSPSSLPKPSFPSPSSLPKPSFSSKQLGAKKSGSGASIQALESARAVPGPASLKQAAPASRPSSGRAGASAKPIEQWANGLVGASSQFSNSDNSARQMLGRHNVYPQAGKNTRAWSPVPRPGHSREWVRLLFRQPVWAESMVVYQTFNPGSLVE